MDSFAIQKCERCGSTVVCKNGKCLACNMMRDLRDYVKEAVDLFNQKPKKQGE